MVGPQTRNEGNYSFVVHADPAMPSESPLGLEMSNSAKQKRRRTSPHDHAILEAAYQRNSKPDKHERADIVSRVELGEKEVQIWFQNRRQNDRRKSKPLQPHELLAHLRSGAPGQASPKANIDENGELQPAEEVSVAAKDLARPSSRSSSIHELLNPLSSAESTKVRSDLSGQIPSDQLPTPPSSFERTQKPDKISATGSEVDTPSNVNTQPTHARKRSHEVMTENQIAQTVDVRDGEPVRLPQPKALTRSSSFIRLAMTVDGAVKVRTNDEPTPSPPKQRVLPPIVPARKRESLGRSQSAIENGFMFKDINPPIRRPGEAGFGRSRDARTWEFYCDRDSGDALSTQAEAERSGSAIGAINLIRSQSQRNKPQALSPNPMKQNARRSRVNPANKTKLVRTMSSMARLQSLDSAPETVQTHSKRAKHEQSPSGDSDKENWAPGTRNSNHPMRRMHPSTPRDSVLREQGASIAQDQIRGATVKEQQTVASASKEKAKVDDLDCIQGLLSLSQGAWR